jgi:hypothetical protein
MRGLAFITCALAACTSTANVAGNYTIAATNRDNSCGFPGWTVGAQATGIQVTITQSGSGATAIIMGGGGFILDGLIGTHTFAGHVSGDSMDLTATGTTTHNQGNCTYTVNGEIHATLSGDSLTGTIDYTGAGNGMTDCAGITGCVSFQDFNGTRPPH